MRYLFITTLSLVLLMCSCRHRPTSENDPIRLFSDSIAYYSSCYWGVCDRDPLTGEWSEWEIDSIHPAVVAFDAVTGRYYTFMLQRGQYSLSDYYNTDSVEGSMIMHPLSNIYQVIRTSGETASDSSSVFHFWSSSLRLFDGEKTDPNTDVTMIVNKDNQIMFKIITDDENWFFDGISYRDVSGPQMDWLIQTLNSNNSY